MHWWEFKWFANDLLLYHLSVVAWMSQYTYTLPSFLPSFLCSFSNPFFVTFTLRTCFDDHDDITFASSIAWKSFKWRAKQPHLHEMPQMSMGVEINTPLGLIAHQQGLWVVHIFGCKMGSPWTSQSCTMHLRVALTPTQPSQY